MRRVGHALQRCPALRGCGVGDATAAVAEVEARAGYAVCGEGRCGSGVPRQRRGPEEEEGRRERKE
jgi:hypothetical protein